MRKGKCFGKEREDTGEFSATGGPPDLFRFRALIRSHKLDEDVRSLYLSYENRHRSWAPVSSTWTVSAAFACRTEAVSIYLYLCFSSFF